MRTELLHAISLRQMGKSYSEIARELEVSKSSVHKWLSRIDWSGEVGKTLRIRNFSVERMARLRERRSEESAKRQKMMINKAISDFSTNIRDPFFNLGIGIYLSSGDKSLKNNFVRVSSSDFTIIKIFNLFLDHFCIGNFKSKAINLKLSHEQNVSQCREVWLERLKMPLETKITITMSRTQSQSKKLHYGIATIIISSKLLKSKIVKWSELLRDHVEI